MSARLQEQPRDLKEAWHAMSRKLAKWAKRYFVRLDRYGGYYRKDGRAKPFTQPPDGPREDCVTLELLVQHFEAEGTEDVIGAHALDPDGGGRWAAVDIDAHDGTSADPETNERFALAIHADAVRAGFCPLTYESNGKGGFHVVVFFDVPRGDPVPGHALYGLARWLARRYAEFGFNKPPETYPKQRAVAAGGYGSWLRIIGRHHTHDFWPRVWDGAEWLAGEDAVEHVLTVWGDDPELIPMDALALAASDAPEPPARTPAQDLRPGDDFNQRGESAIRELLHKHGWTLARQRGDGVSEWTRPGKADGCSGTLGFCTGANGVPKFYCWSSNAAPLEANRPYTPFDLLTVLDHGGDYRAAATALRADGYGTESDSALSPDGTGKLPVILVGTDEHRVNDEAVAALSFEPGVYQRGQMLVQVLTAPVVPEQVVRRPVGVPIIRPYGTAGLREELTRCARWVQPTDDGDQLVHPPGWAIQAVLARGAWAGVPRLEAVVTHPALLGDGTVLSADGYDRRSGLLVRIPPEVRLTIPDAPTAADVAHAVAELFDVVADFPFKRSEHRAAWMASLLTPLAWFAFNGPAPWFLIDKNVRGAGAGLLADVVSLIVTGRRFPVMSYTPEREELRKRITTLAVEGERLVLLDNLAGAVGNDVLDAALTADTWKDRLLGSNRGYNGPLHVVWYGTGNNVQLQADTARRVCQIRMETADERPEERTGFRYPDLREHVRANRGRLLSAALTILRGWFVVGRPRHDLLPWGSFEGWSGLVREAVVFAGLPDPGATRTALRTSADRDAGAMIALLGALVEMDPHGRGVTTAQIVERVKTPAYPPADWHAGLRSAVEELCGRLDVRLLGYRFRQFQRRNFDGQMLDKAGSVHGSNLWVVVSADGISARPDDVTHVTHRNPDPDLNG